MSSKVQTTTESSDNRVQLDTTGGGKFVAPQAVSSDPGSFAMSTGEYSNVDFSAAEFHMGMTGQEVKDLLGQQASIASEQIQSISQSSKSAIAAATQAVTATKATEIAAAVGEPTWSKYVPFGIVALAALWFLKGKRA